jgi:hypothetical protein
MGNDEASEPDGELPWRPTIEEIEEAIEEFDVLEHYDHVPDDDYAEMSYGYYKRILKVFKWFKDEHDKYRDCAISAWRKEDILLERIKWFEIEKEQLEEQLEEIKRNIDG